MYAMMVTSFIRILLLAGALHAITAASIPKASSLSNDNSSAIAQTQIAIRNGSRTAASAALLVHRFRREAAALRRGFEFPVPLSALGYRLGPVVKAFYYQHGKHAVNLGQDLLRPSVHFPRQLP
jgi:hypothetical protein